MTSASRPALRQPPLWVIVAAGGIITSISLGVRSTFGLFLDPIAEGLDTGRGSIALAIAVQNLVWGISQPVAGAISDRYGAARTLAGGGVLYAGALLLMSTATGPGLVVLSGGFLVGLAIGAASFAVVLSSIGRMVRPERRSLMLGIVSAVGSLGQFVLIPIAQSLLDRTSWETTVVVMAAVAAVLIVFTPALRGCSADFADPAVADHAEPRTLRAELRRASGSKSYLMLNGAFFVCGFHVTFIGIHLPAYVGDLGQPASVGATALALIGLFNVFGSLGAGALGARFSPTLLLAGIYGLRAVVIAGFVLLPQSSTSTILFAAAIGTLWLATVPLTSAIVAQQFGTTHAGALFGIVFLSHQIGAFIGAWMGGEVVDATGSYSPVWWTAVGLGVGAMMLHLLIDEGPVPDEPGPSRIRLAPAIWLAAVGLATIVTIGSATEPAESTVDEAPRVFTGFCGLTGRPWA